MIPINLRHSVLCHTISVKKYSFVVCERDLSLTDILKTVSVKTDTYEQIRHASKLEEVKKSVADTGKKQK